MSYISVQGEGHNEETYQQFRSENLKEMYEIDLLNDFLNVINKSVQLG